MLKILEKLYSINHMDLNNLTFLNYIELSIKGTLKFSLGILFYLTIVLFIFSLVYLYIAKKTRKKDWLFILLNEVLKD